MNGLTKIIIMIMIAAGLLAFDYINSSKSVNLSSTSLFNKPLDIISSNIQIQRAYERCRFTLMNEHKSKNLHLSQEEMNLTFEIMPDVCKETILGMCESHDATTNICRFGLMPYTEK